MGILNCRHETNDSEDGLNPQSGGGEFGWDFSEYGDWGEPKLNILHIGGSGVGKSSFIESFTNIPSKENLDFYRVTRENITLNMWDMKAFHPKASSFYHKADGIVMMFDLTDWESVNLLRQLLSDVERFATGKPKVLIGNKSDLNIETPMSEEGIKEFAKDQGFIDYIKTSATANTNIELAIRTLTVKVIEKKKQSLKEDVDGFMDMYGNEVEFFTPEVARKLFKAGYNKFAINATPNNIEVSKLGFSEDEMKGYQNLMDKNRREREELQRQHRQFKERQIDAIMNSVPSGTSVELFTREIGKKIVGAGYAITELDWFLRADLDQLVRIMKFGEEEKQGFKNWLDEMRRQQESNESQQNES